MSRARGGDNPRIRTRPEPEPTRASWLEGPRGGRYDRKVRALRGVIAGACLALPLLAQDGAQAGRVRLQVSTDPPDAAVYVQYPGEGREGERRRERFLGKTPSGGALSLDLEPGPAEVVVWKDGYVCKVEPLDVPAGGAARLELRLTPDVEIPRGLTLKSAVPFVRDAREGTEIYLAVLAHVHKFYVDETDPRRLIDASLRVLVDVLNAVRSRELLLRRELQPEARLRYYGEEVDLRDYPRLTLVRGSDADGRRRYALSAGTIGIEGETDEGDLDTYVRMLERSWGFVRHRWDARGLLSDSVVAQCLIEGLLSGLNDLHTGFLNPEEVAEMAVETTGSFGGVGLVVSQDDGRLVVVATMPGTPAERAGIHSGDWILSIDGQSTQRMLLRQAVTLMRGEVDSPVELVVRRGAEDLRRTLLRAKVHVRSLASRLIGQDVGYLRITSFMQEELDREVKDAIVELRRLGAKALVIDLRQNPGGLLSQACAIADLFVPRGTIVSTRTRLPGESRTLEAEPGPKLDLPIAVLIDGQSASAAEILAGTLQDHGLATLVGQRSYGKGSVQRVFRLNPFRCELALTVATYHLPDGATPHGKGVTPDVPVELSEEEAARLLARSNYTVEKEEVDPQLQAALDVVRAKIKR